MPDLHDAALLQSAQEIVVAESIQRLRQRLDNLVESHHNFRAASCINLVAAEAPSSTYVRRFLATDLGARASGGAIGRANRYFTGLDHADEIEALCIALLKQLFGCSYADQRLLGGLHATTVVYAAWKPQVKTLMSLHPSTGGDTSNRHDGPPGVFGMAIHDIPVQPTTLEIDLDMFSEVARRLRPELVSLGAGLNLFPFPVREIKTIISEWEGRLYFDGAHQAGLIAGRAYPNPLAEGADVLSGSTGKTFSGPQGGILCWNRDEYTQGFCEMIFPHLTGTHQLNRVAALVAACLENRAFGVQYMAQVVKNARALAASLAEAGVMVMCADAGFTSTHQVAVDAAEFGQGHDAALALAEAHVIGNKLALPGDPANDPRGVRFGTVEVTRLGMVEADMQQIGRLIADLWTKRRPVSRVKQDVLELRNAFPVFPNLLFSF